MLNAMNVDGKDLRIIIIMFWKTRLYLPYWKDKEIEEDKAGSRAGIRFVT